MLVLAAGNSKKEVPTIKIVEIAVHRSSSDRLISIDGRIVNSGRNAIRNLMLIFEVTGVDGQVVSRQRGKVEEDPFDPGAESEFHWQMSDQPAAVEVGVRAVAHDDRPVKVEEPGPYAIE
jgi:hypothetical protein